MSRAPRLTGAELIAALERAGYQVVRIRGSHHFCGTRMAVLPLCPSLDRKQSAPDGSSGLSAIAS